jgi:hypothetical protein
MVTLFLLPETLVLLNLVRGQNWFQVNLLCRMPDVRYLFQLSLFYRSLSTPVFAQSLLLVLLQNRLIVSISVRFVRVFVQILEPFPQFVPLILYLHTLFKLLLLLFELQRIQEPHDPAICATHYHFLHLLRTYLPIFAHVEVFVCSTIECHFEVILCLVVSWVIKSSSIIFHHCSKGPVSENTIE